MEIIAISDPRFAPYGRALAGYAADTLLRALNATVTPPEAGTAYVPSLPLLEAQPTGMALRDRGFGGLPIQIGWCGGVNDALTCLEYHRSSEIDIAATDMLLLLARQQELADGTLDAACVRAFLVPAGTAVELYATTLHYAPCGAQKGAPFLMACVLPRGTNLERPAGDWKDGEDRLLFGANKWVVAGPDTAEARQGAFPGLHGGPVSPWD